MSADPRRLFQEAAQLRSPLELMPRQGGLVRGVLVRVEKSGLVVTVPARRLTGGEDLRCWVSINAMAYTFEASVIRAGVPVPDRSQDGVLLGFIDRFVEAGPSASGGGGRLVELVPPSGQPVSLLVEPARLLHLAVDGASFSLPAGAKLVWVEQGRVSLRLGVPGREPVMVSGRVRTLASTDQQLLYDLQFEGVEDPVAHRFVVDALASTL